MQLEVNWQVCGSLPRGCKKEDYEQPPDRIVTEENIDKYYELSTSFSIRDDTLLKEQFRTDRTI